MPEPSVHEVKPGQPKSFEFSYGADKVIVGYGNLESGIGRFTVRLYDANQEAFSMLIDDQGMAVWQALAKGRQMFWENPIDAPLHREGIKLEEAMYHILNQKECGGLGWIRGFGDAIAPCGPNFGGPTEGFALHGDFLYLGPESLKVKYYEEGKSQCVAIQGTAIEKDAKGKARFKITTTYIVTFGRTGFTKTVDIKNISRQPQLLEYASHDQLRPSGKSELILPIPDDSWIVGPGEVRIKGDGKLPPYNRFLDKNRLPQEATPEYCLFVPRVVPIQDGRAIAMLRDGDFAVTKSWDTKASPCLTLWYMQGGWFLKNTEGTPQYPTRKVWNVIGVETGTNLPASREEKSADKYPYRRVQTIKPGEKWRFTDGYRAYDEAATIDGIVSKIRSKVRSQEKI